MVELGAQRCPQLSDAIAKNMRIEARAQRREHRRVKRDSGSPSHCSLEEDDQRANHGVHPHSGKMQ